MKKISKNVIPCKRSRCIVYPTCRNKAHIRCNILNDYYDSMKSNDITTRYRIGRGGFRIASHRDIWGKYIVRHFPNIISLAPEINREQKR